MEVSGQMCPPPTQPLYPWERTWVAIDREAGWNPQLVWMFWRIETISCLNGIRTPYRTARSLVATPESLYLLANSKNNYSGVCYNERMLQRTVFINKIGILQRTRKNTIGRRSTRVRMTCGAFPLWLERQSSFLLTFVRFSYHLSN